MLFCVLGHPVSNAVVFYYPFITEVQRDRMVAWHLGALGRHP